MSNLIKSIVHNGTRYTFLFRRVSMRGSIKYFITAFDKVEDKQSFEMKKNGSSWHIVPPAPDWAEQLEKQLSDILMEEGAD